MTLTPIQIDPAGFYRDGDVRLMFELTDAALSKARRRGDLRFTRRGRQIFYRGQWLIDWLDSYAPRPEETSNA